MQVVQIYTKLVDAYLYDVWIAFEGGVTLACYEVEAVSADSICSRIDNLPFAPSTRTRQWLNEHADFIRAQQTKVNPRF